MNDFVYSLCDKNAKEIDRVYIFECKKKNRFKTIYKRINFDIILEKTKTLTICLLEYIKYHEKNSIIYIEIKETLEKNLDLINKIFRDNQNEKIFRKDYLDNHIEEIVFNLKYICELCNN